MGVSAAIAGAVIGGVSAKKQSDAAKKSAQVQAAATKAAADQQARQAQASAQAAAVAQRAEAQRAAVAASSRLQAEQGQAEVGVASVDPVGGAVETSAARRVRRAQFAGSGSAIGSSGSIRI